MADKTIGDLNFAPGTVDDSNTLFVVQQTGAAYKLSGHEFILALTTILDGHGGISSIAYTPPVSPSLTGTMVITLADQSTTSVEIQNGKGITGISKIYTQGLVDTYRISYNDGTTSNFFVTNGAKGDTGQAWYVWVRYAGQQPTSDADIGTTPDNWMGIYSGTSATAPTTYTSYQWFQIKGEQGDKGDTGASIASVVRTSGDGSPGTYDTYTVTLDNGIVAGTFTVYNGLNGSGAVGSVNNVQPDSSGNVTLVASDISTSSSSTVQATLTDLSSNKQNRITANGMLKGNGTSVIAATLGSDYTAVDDTLSSSSTKTYSITKQRATFVPYDTAITLTTAQQKQSRDNIDAEGKWVKLWENASTDDFPAQTIPLDLSAYKDIRIWYDWKGTRPPSRVAFSQVGLRAELDTNFFGSYPISMTYRVVSAISTTGITFAGGYEKAADSGSTAPILNNSNNVPIIIEGVLA